MAELRTQIVVTSAVCAVAIPLFLYFLLFAHKGVAPVMGMGVIVLFAVGNLVVLIRMGTGHAAEGDVRLSIANPRPEPGGRLTANVFLPRSAVPLRTMYATLVCRRIDAHSKAEETLWSTEQEFPITPNVRGAIVKVAIDIPKDAQPTALPSCRWELELSTDASDIDFDRSFQVLVGGEAAVRAVAPVAPVVEEHSALWVLVLANLLPLAGAILWGWRMQDVVLLYWMENLVIGAFHLLRILVATGDIMTPLARRGALPANFNAGAQLLLAKLVLVAAFVLSYGFFCFVHGEFLVNFLPMEERTGGLWEIVGRSLQERNARLALAVIGVSHAYTFLRNYLGRGEYRNADLVELMTRPYKRIAVTQFFVLAGGFALAALKSPAAAMAAFVAIKIWFDARAHRQERRRLAVTS